MADNKMPLVFNDLKEGDLFTFSNGPARLCQRLSGSQFCFFAKDEGDGFRMWPSSIVAAEDNGYREVVQYELLKK